MEMINIMTQYHNLYWSITSHNKYLLSIFRFLQESDYKLLYLMTWWDHRTVITRLFQYRQYHPHHHCRSEVIDLLIISEISRTAEVSPGLREGRRGSGCSGWWQSLCRGLNTGSGDPASPRYKRNRPDRPSLYTPPWRPEKSTCRREMRDDDTGGWVTTVLPLVSDFLHHNGLQHRRLVQSRAASPA